MLKRVLKQMQFTEERLGGGHSAMTLYKDGHVITVAIDAMIDFESVSPDRPIALGVYRTVTQYEWADRECVMYREASTQSDAITHVVDALESVAIQHAKHCDVATEALAKVWTLIEQRHHLSTCAYEVTTDELDAKHMHEVTAYITLWDALTQ